MDSESMPVVLDISSDEESGLNELAKTDYDWIKELLGESDKESDDSEEVVIIGEVKPEWKSKSLMPTMEDVDDDCVVLDGDPEDSITSVNETETESDELLVVGEKGQIACRDYPHPRHLCAKFPFSSTPHEKHCDQCHCYVCDSLAPCLKWGTGISSIDHCHASEKVEIWRTQRKNFKLGMSAPLPSPYVAHPQQNQVPECDIIVLSPCSMVQSQACSQATLRSCSSLDATSENQSSGPGIEHARTLINSMLQSQACGQVALRSCSSLNATSENQSSGPGIMRARSLINSMLQSQACTQAALRSCSSPSATSENQSSGPGIMRASSLINSTIQNQVSGPNANAIPFCSSTINCTDPDSANLDSCQESVSTLARTRYQPHIVPRQILRVRNNAIRRERGRGMSSLGPQSLGSHLISKRLGSVEGSVTVDLDSSGYSNYVNQAEQYDRYHAATETSDDQNPNGYVWSTTNLSSYSHPSTMQPSVNCASANTMPFENQTYRQSLSQLNDSQNFYQSCIQGNNAPSSYGACMSSNQHGNEHQIGKQNENGSQNVIQYGIPSQEACQQKPHEENQSEVARKADFSDFDSSWTGNSSQCNDPLIGSCHPQSSGSTNQPEPPNINESNSQFNGSTDLGHLAEFEEWLLEKESSSVIVDGAVPSELNFPSPEIPQVDAGMFSFDFDPSSWNGLAHV